MWERQKGKVVPVLHVLSSFASGKEPPSSVFLIPVLDAVDKRKPLLSCREYIYIPSVSRNSDGLDGRSCIPGRIKEVFSHFVYICEYIYKEQQS
jgi:hypothetical protein